jgi:Protein of unknown function (DUF2971)
MKSTSEIHNEFQALWDDIQQATTFPEQRPLLAHYTSISTLESIMSKDELWFSNPLFMNDLEELRFGILEGAKAFRRCDAIRLACNTPQRYELILNEFERLLDQFSNEHAFDTYVFCLSEHDITKDTDGLLSMWRGYGGNGNGAAILFDSTKFNYIAKSPMIISKVNYATQSERIEWLDAKFNKFSELLSNADIPDNQLFIPVHAIFERLKIFSIFTKHRGFIEEKEWRVAYLRERDTDHKMDEMLHYSISTNGIEPKLKFKVRPIDGLTTPDLSLENIIFQIILGPSISNPLSINSVKRMLEKLNKHELANKLVASTTPFRTK